jgi:cyclin-dependent kinase-like
MLSNYYINRSNTNIKGTMQDDNSMIMPLYSNLQPPTNDQSLTEGVGYSFVISDKLLGSGSYGQVFEATDENGRKVAVKCCPMDDTGIPNILEASIMAAIVHPYLNKALRIYATEHKLYIIQELAGGGDMAHYTRRDKNKHSYVRPSLAELQTWCFSIGQAVAALHGQQIVHGDIKASNVLRYDDGTIKLSDFTLAVKKWASGEKFNHNTCTCTHRPLECLIKSNWNESLDIWSLGCTFYEIAYGEPLFIYQGSIEPEVKIKDKEFKMRLRRRSVNAIVDWALRGPNPSPVDNIDYLRSLQCNDLQYYPFELCAEYYNPEMASLNDLINKMLVIEPERRLTIKEVLAHEFFTGLKPVTYLTIRRPINKLEITEEARVATIIAHCTDDDNIQRLALNIYCRCNQLGSIKEVIRAKTCVYIASKIVLGIPSNNMQLSQYELLKTEREICHNLAFRLHS